MTKESRQISKNGIVDGMTKESRQISKDAISFYGGNQRRKLPGILDPNYGAKDEKIAKARKVPGNIVLDEKSTNLPKFKKAKKVIKDQKDEPVDKALTNNRAIKAGIEVVKEMMNSKIHT